jgi:hypothetical protein
VYVQGVPVLRPEYRCFPGQYHYTEQLKLKGRNNTELNLGIKKIGNEDSNRTKKKSATLAHRFNSRGYRTYW